MCVCFPCLGNESPIKVGCVRIISATSVYTRRVGEKEKQRGVWKEAEISSMDQVQEKLDSESIVKLIHRSGQPCVWIIHQKEFVEEINESKYKYVCCESTKNMTCQINLSGWQRVRNKSSSSLWCVWGSLTVVWLVCKLSAGRLPFAPSHQGSLNWLWAGDLCQPKPWTGEKKPQSETFIVEAVLDWST